MKRLLFIGHEASRTGAPMLLLQFLRWLKTRGVACDVDVLLLQDGELADDYREVANVHVMSSEPPRRPRGLKRLGRKIGLVPKQQLPTLPPFHTHYDLVVGNTVLALEQLATFGRRGCRTVAWLHELDYVVDEFSVDRFLELSQEVDRFLVVSNAVSDMLRRLGVQRWIHVVHGFPKNATVETDGVAWVRKRLGIPPDAFLIGGCGTIEWRKGVDLFLQVAHRMGLEDPHAHFLWVGGGSSHASAEFRRVQHDFDRLELDGRVVFAGAQKDPEAFLAAMDVFALTSREDPFPLVCLEAASLGKPVVCFDRAGGMPEFVAHDAGAVVPYGDIGAFVECLLHFRNNRADALRAGAMARAKVESRFSMEYACPRMWNVFRAAAASGLAA
jgi:glycosyltransferase involved in cell wall biosynthesis